MSQVNEVELMELSSDTEEIEEEPVPATVPLTSAGSVRRWGDTTL